MKGARMLVWVIAGLTLAGTASYVFVYLYRWEWNRAIISGLLFLAAEVAVAAWLLSTRIADISKRLDDQPDRRRAITAHLSDAQASSRSAAFAWLKPDRPHVFIPILMGAGLVLSGLAWAVERIAGATAGRSMDRTLAGHLSRLGPPRGGFLDDRADPLRDLRGPR